MKHNVSTDGKKETLIIVDVDSESLRNEALKYDGSYSGLYGDSVLFRKLSFNLFGYKYEKPYHCERVIVADPGKTPTYSNLYCVVGSPEYYRYVRVFCNSNPDNINPDNIVLRHPDGIINKEGMLYTVYSEWDNINNDDMLSDKLLDTLAGCSIDFSVRLTGKSSTQEVTNGKITGWVVQCKSEGEPDDIELYHKKLVAGVNDYLSGNDFVSRLTYKCGVLKTITTIEDTTECVL